MTDTELAAPHPAIESARTDLTLADLTTLRVGGPIAQFVRTTTESDLISVIQYADDNGIDLLVLGDGSNIVAGDQGFAGIVVQDGRSGVKEDLIDSCGGASVTVPAGQNWDSFVAHAITQEWVGVECLIGIPGTVGAAPVQNIGAYGQEVSQVISSVRVYDRQEKRARMFAVSELEFSYRDSKLKRTMTTPDLQGHRWGPSPRYIVLEVSFQFRLGTLSAPIGYGELGRKLGVEVGDRVNCAAVAQAVLELRAGKDMLVDAFERPHLEATPGACGTLAFQEGHKPAKPTANRWSAGSFFTNPIVSAETVLPEGAPTYPVASATPEATTGPSHGKVDPTKVKTSAAWLIEQAGFHKGFSLNPSDPPASLSTVHTLALTNRGNASSADIIALARAVRDGVAHRFGITLTPEPVLVGITL